MIMIMWLELDSQQLVNFASFTLLTCLIPVVAVVLTIYLN